MIANRHRPSSIVYRPSSAESAFEALYREAWADLARLRQDPITGPWLLPEATPVLAYGAWQTARVVTAALNPSEDEFQTRDTPRQALPAGQQRLLHWPADGTLTPARLAEARRRAEGYFTRGRAYTTWFARYDGLLAALGTPFAGGLACQTNYGSPFTTRVGWGAVGSAACRAALARHGGPLWRRLLDLLPALTLIVGQGAGWRTVPALFGFTPADWEPVPTPFDGKGGARGPRPHLLTAPVTVAGRAVRLAWWRPNRGGPLTYLSRADGAALGAILAGLVESRESRVESGR